MITLLSMSGLSFMHPVYLGVTSIHFNDKDKKIEVSIKVFNDDFEKSLKQETNQKIDILNNSTKLDLNQIISDYSLKHFIISASGKTLQQQFIGFENEKDVTWIYLAYTKPETVKNLHIENTFLYNSFPDQTHIISLETSSVKRSGKISNPDSGIDFDL